MARSVLQISRVTAFQLLPHGITAHWKAVLRAHLGVQIARENVKIAEALAFSRPKAPIEFFAKIFGFHL
jgi:hypothetical protein